MCGIFYARSFEGEPVGKVIRKGYFGQKERGTEGYGFVAIRDGNVSLHKALYEHQIMQSIKNDGNANEIIFHHRFPTSTDNTVQTAHPIVATAGSVYENNWYLVHNGCIWNYDTLYKKHKELGIEYSTEHSAMVTVKKYASETYETQELRTMFNDSECLLHELALTIENKQDSTDFNIAGSLAFILLQTDKDNKPIALYFGRNTGSPLNMMLDKVFKKMFFLSSSGPGGAVPADKLFRYEYATESLGVVDMKFDKFDYDRYNKGVSYYDDVVGGKDFNMCDMNDDIPQSPIAADFDWTSVQDTSTLELCRAGASLRKKREKLITKLARAQRTENYDKEYKITEQLDLLDEYIEMVDKELTRREMTIELEKSD